MTTAAAIFARNIDLLCQFAEGVRTADEVAALLRPEGDLDGELAAFFEGVESVSEVVARVF